MKARYIGIALATGVALGGIWVGRMVWRARHDRITLNMRNAPLAAVARAIEHQTWANILIDTKLNPRITIKVKDAPLSRVLDLVADKAGARWQKTFAVYGSDGALTSLESALRGDEKLDAAGWTNLAPDITPDISETAFQPPPPGDGAEKPPRVGPLLRRLGPGGSPEGGSRTGGAGGMRMITMLPDGTVDRWSAERLVLETRLTAHLGGEPPGAATPESAIRTAEAVHGRIRVYYGLDAAPFAIGGSRHVHTAQGGARPGNIGDVAANLAQERREQRLRELGNSPEEQVERARQQGSHQMQIQTLEDEDVK
jgi:hypothetical protein